MGAPLGDVLGAWQKETEEAWKREYLEKAVSVLDEEERRIIWLHYGVQVNRGSWPEFTG